GRYLSTSAARNGKVSARSAPAINSICNRREISMKLQPPKRRPLRHDKLQQVHLEIPPVHDAGFTLLEAGTSEVSVGRLVPTRSTSQAETRESRRPGFLPPVVFNSSSSFSRPVPP